MPYFGWLGVDAIIEKEKTGEEIWEEKSQFCSGQVRVEMPVRNTVRATKEICGYLSSELRRGSGLEMKIGAVSQGVVFRVPGLDERPQGITVGGGRS